LNYIGFSLMI